MYDPRLACAAAMLVVVSTLHAQHVKTERERREAIAHYRIGRELMSSEKFDAAVEEFDKAIKTDALFTLAHYSLGQAYMNLRRYASAIVAFRACIDASRTLYSLAESERFAVEKQRDDEIHEARETLRRLSTAAARRPGSGYQALALQMERHLHDLETQKTSIAGPFRPPAEALLSLGSALFRNGDRQAAELEWRAALDVKPDFGEAHNNLAVSYMQTGRLDEADQELALAEKSGFRVNPQFKADLKARRK
jgi:tetratricopeptide (TPR) repeat protein